MNSSPRDHTGSVAMLSVTLLLMTSFGLQTLVEAPDVPHHTLLPPENVSSNTGQNTTGGGLQKLIQPKEQRILCWVMTWPQNHNTKAKAVKATWGRRCDILLFMSSTSDPSLPTVALPVQDGPKHLWQKTRETFKYLHKQGYLDQVDWILKADDDTFMLVENLRGLLSLHDPSDPLILGLHLNLYLRTGVISGAPGYVLSRRAAQLFVEKATPDCPEVAKDDDLEMTLCMSAVNAAFVDTRDAEGKETFYFRSPEMEVSPDKMSHRYEQVLFHNVPQVHYCCSSTPVAFHYISPSLMYTLDYLLYRVKVLWQFTKSGPDYVTSNPEPEFVSSGGPRTFIATEFLTFSYVLLVLW